MFYDGILGGNANKFCRFNSPRSNCTNVCVFLSLEFYLCREIFVSPSGADSPNCTTEDNPCKTIAHALEVVAATNDVIRMDGNSANFTVRRRLKISKPMNITFSSYNGVAWICGGGDDIFPTFLHMNSFYPHMNDVSIIIFRAINFCNIYLCSAGSFNIFGFPQIARMKMRLKVEMCGFYFSHLSNASKKQFFRQNLLYLQMKAASITIDNCWINANHQVGILLHSSNDACLDFRSITIAFNNTKIQNAKYIVYSILQKCTDRFFAKSFKLKIFNSTFTSDGKQQSRTPQFSVVIGRQIRFKIWLLIYIKNSRFENLSVVTQAAAVMDIQGPSIVRMRNSTFIGNTGYRGGALALQSTFVEMIDCHFYNNIAKVYSICAHKDQGGNGGAVFTDGLSGSLKLRVQNCSFINNSANCFGSAWYVGYFSSISVRNTQFSSERHVTSQALWFSYSDNLMLDNVSFEAEEIQRY